MTLQPSLSIELEGRTVAPPATASGRATDRDPGPKLGDAVWDLLRHPGRALIRGWNWKAALFSVVLRAVMFFLTNLRAGKGNAVHAMVVEAAYASVASGLLAAVTEHVRRARPKWLTGVLIWLVLPAMLLGAQYLVHHAMGTPRLKTSMIASFCFAAVATGFNWYAMQRGVMLVGVGAGGRRTSLVQDLRALPGTILGFVLAAPRALLNLRWTRQR